MKNNGGKYCSICMEAAPEDAAILAIGRLGYPRYLCDKCDALLSTATSSRDFVEISHAFDELGERIARGANDDEITAEAIADILAGARTRAEAIKDGSYDFSAEETADDGESATDGEVENVECDSEGLPFGIEEELTEEERLENEAKEKREKRINTITNWICAAVFVGVIAYCVWALFFK